MLALSDIGRMGQAMARNLLNPAFASSCSIARAGAPKSCGTEGAEVADSPAAACKGEVVITLLADDDAVEEVVLGSGRVIGALREDGRSPLDESNHRRAFRRADRGAPYSGQHFVAAPVFGRPEAAAAAKLFIVAAGGAGSLDRCQPLFDALGQKNIQGRGTCPPKPT